MNKTLALLGGKKLRIKPFVSGPIIGNEERKLVNEVLKSGKLSGFIAHAGNCFGGGAKVRELEDMFKKYFSCKHAIAANSATAALHMAVAACGVGPGDEVIVSPYTMTASASAILMTNAMPVFADIEEKTYCLDPKQIEKKITSRTKAIIVVHLFGHPADMDAINKIARKHKLYVIEDAAQAPAATYKGKFAGTIGDAGIFSLNQHKTITTGEGGLVVTNDAIIAEKSRLIRNHGEVIVSPMGVKDIVNTLGWNYRMTELEAAVGIGQFRKLNYLTEYRINLANYLTKRLREFNFPGIELPEISKGKNHVYFVYPIKFKEENIGISRSTFVKAINAEGIPLAAGYVKPIYLEPAYQQKLCYGKKKCPFGCPLYKGKVSYRKGICPIAEKMYGKELITTNICHYPVRKNDVDDFVRAFEKVFSNIPDLKKWENKNG